MLVSALKDVKAQLFHQNNYSSYQKDIKAMKDHIVEIKDVSKIFVTNSGPLELLPM